MKNKAFYTRHGATGPTGPTGPATIDIYPEVDELEPGNKPTVENVGPDNQHVELRFGIPRGATGSSGKSAYEIAVSKGYDGSEAEWLAGLQGKSAYEIAVAKGYDGSEAEWLASLKGKSAYEIAVEKGFDGSEEEWLESLKALSVSIIPFASQQAPYVGANASGEPINAAPLGFGYLGFAVGAGGENAHVAVPIDPSDGSFNLGAGGNENRQVAFTIPFEMKLNSIYLTTGNWERFSSFIPPGTEVFPYVQLYTAPAGTNTFLPLKDAVVKPIEGLHPESAQASTMLMAETSGLAITLKAGTRIAICGMMEITGDTAPRNYYLYFTGGIGLSS